MRVTKKGLTVEQLAIALSIIVFAVTDLYGAGAVIRVVAFLPVLVYGHSSEPFAGVGALGRGCWGVFGMRVTFADNTV